MSTEKFEVKGMKRTIIVMGCCRSGMSLTMQMLNAGGVPCVGEYPAFEQYRVNDVPWEAVKGKAVKLVNSEVQLPPSSLDARAIVTSRSLIQQTLSTDKFMRYVHGIGFRDLSQLKDSIMNSYVDITEYIRKENMECLHLKFEDVITDALGAARRISKYLEGEVECDPEVMAKVVYERDPECYDGMLELKLLGLEDEG